VTDDLLARALRAPIILPAARDWSFRWDAPADSDGGWNRYHWSASDQASIEALWDSRATAICDALIGAHGAMWPWLSPRAITAGHPTMSQRVSALAEAGQIAQGHTYRDLPDSTYEHALMFGPWDHMRAIRQWPGPVDAVCPICGTAFFGGQISPWMVRQYGTRYCPSCCVRARNGASHESADQVVRGLRCLSEAIEAVPDQQLASRITITAMDQDRRDRVMRALVLAPSAIVARQLLGTVPWLVVLQVAGLVGDAWRPSLGTYCVASDGHLCRSLGERTVDDWLTAHGIAHECEPAYPGTKKRADWRLPDGRYVELAGLMGDKDYRAAMAEKRVIAARAGITLVVLLPENLTDLATALA
jgi:hypothetical protein